MKLKDGCLYYNRLGELVIARTVGAGNLSRHPSIMRSSFYMVKVPNPDSLFGYYVYENGKFHSYNAKNDQDVIAEVNDPVLRSFYDYGE